MKPVTYIRRPAFQMVKLVRFTSNQMHQPPYGGDEQYPNQQQNQQQQQDYQSYQPANTSPSTEKNRQALGKIKKHLQDLQDLGEKLKENLKNRLNKDQ